MTPDREDMLKACEMLCDWVVKRRSAARHTDNVSFDVESRCGDVSTACCVTVWIISEDRKIRRRERRAARFVDAATEAINRIDADHSAEREDP